MADSPGCVKCKQAAELAALFKDNVARVARGERIVDLAQAERRLVICRTCPNFIPESMRCTKCGCFLSVKAPLVTARCPDGRW